MVKNEILVYEIRRTCITSAKNMFKLANQFAGAEDIVDAIPGK